MSNAARRWISCRSRGRYLSYCSFRRIRRSPPGRALASLPWRPARETEAHNHMGRSQASWTQWRQGCLVSVAGEAGRHAPTLYQSFDELRSLQPAQDLISGGHFLYQAKNSRPPMIPLYCSYRSRPRLRSRAARGGGRSLEHDGKRSLHTDYLEGRAVAAAGQRREPGAIT